MASKQDPQIDVIAVEVDEIIMVSDDDGAASGAPFIGSGAQGSSDQLIAERPQSYSNRQTGRQDRGRKDGSGAGRAMAGLGLAAATAGAAFFFAKKMGQQQDGELGDGPNISDAPDHVLRGKAWEKARNTSNEQPLVGRTVTINRPRQELYERWRDFTRFPEFMDNVREIEKLDDKRSRWSIEAPLGATVQVITRIVEDVPGETIAWVSEPDSQIETDGRVEFADAPPGRGTYVRLLIRYKPPAGTLGRAIAKVMQREPNVQTRRDLRRFKQLMETGEIATNASPAGRKADNPPTETHA